jgi:cobalt/nickel transport system permease protein
LRGALQRSRIERWSRGDSLIHRRHAAAKIIATLAFLICVATLTHGTGTICALYLALLLFAASMAGLPVIAILRSAMAVLPFAFCFAVVSALSGDPVRAVLLLVRAYLSSFAALLLIATTPMPALIAGLEWLRAPRFLLQVMQFLYRYLIVMIEEANAMRQAGLARAGSLRALQFRQAAAAVGVLFARSYARAQAIHRAMLARGFEGRLPTFGKSVFRPSDAGFAAGTAVLIIGLRAVLQ